MKLPALWIAAAFAAGIGLITRWPHQPLLYAAVAALAILASSILIWRRLLFASAICALAAWTALGSLALAIEQITVPVNHVTRLIAANRIDLTEPLRWRGRLREDPLVMPWGRRYEIDIEQVESGGQILAASGGLRANIYNNPKQPIEIAETLRAGDRVEALVRARPPRNFLDPGAFDIHGYLARQRIDLIGSLKSGELLRLVDRPTPTLLHRLARMRGNLLARLDTLFAGQPDREAVLRAMLLGDRSFVDSETVTAFQKTAVYHVLVVAGLHVGALAVFFFWLGRKLRFSVGAASLVTLLALAAYVGMVQDRPPILRAALMVALYLCARPFFRRVELLNTIALAALVILFWKPSLLMDSSFELSFLAAGVIAALALPWMDRTSAPYRAGLAHLGDVTRDIVHSPKVIQFRIEMRAGANWLAARMPNRLASRASTLVTLPVSAGLRLWEIVLLSVVIQWSMMPILAQDFHRVSLAGPLSNIPAVILTGLIVPVGFLTLLATFVWARLSLLLARVLGFLATSLLAIVKWVGAWPRVSYRIPGPPIWLIVAFFVALICLAVAARAAVALRSNRFARRKFAPPIRPLEWAAIVALAALTALVATHPFLPILNRGKLEVSVLDVGQGDSIFAAFPDGRTMLIDGGGQPGSEWVGGQRSGLDVGEQVVSPYLWSRGIKRLDVLALTHAHHDHLDGLHSVIQNFRVEELWIGRDEETHAFEDLLKEARERGVRIVHEVSGSKFDWDGVTGDVLWPADPTPVNEASNDDSLVLRLEDGSVRFLLAGDIQKKVEQRLVREDAEMTADFLKVPHHGSKTSSTPDFVAAVAPKVAVVSAGEANPFGHPAPGTVERYEQAGVKLLRTDRDGAVTAITDGHALTVTTFAESHVN
ncbi:MAG TPA: DNA internalization-related competence protein ComEC/Rec2 [Candidatus Acidoferrales bacterium]